MNNDQIAQAKAFNVSIAINVLGALITMWLAFFPKPYLWAAISAMLFPAVYFLNIIFYKGLIRFNTSCLVFMACSITMLTKVISDFEIVDYKNIWIYVPLLTLLILVLLIQFSVEFALKTKQGRTIILSSILFIFFYSLGVYVFFNCLFDQSKPQIVKTTISEMMITRGTKTPTYSLSLRPWGPNKEKDHLTVTEGQYDAAHVGDTVKFELRRGFLNTPWYSVLAIDISSH